MAGYSDTRKLIIDTLMGRPAGTEIKPEDHQAFVLALNDYIRNVELNSGNAFIGFAQSDTVPIQSNNGQCFYISTVPPGTNIVYTNFIDYEGNPISVTTPPNKMAFVTLIWNTRNWDSQITIIETNWSQIFENNIAPNSIDSSKIIDGTIQSTDLNPNAFDNTLTKPDKIAPADVVGSKLTELLSYINGMEGGVNGFAEDTSFQPNYPEDVAATVIGVGPGTFTNMIGENGSAITVDSISVVIFFKAAGSTYWKYKTILPTVVIEGNVELGVKDYAQLQGKPSINGKELASGENSLEALGIQPKGDYTTASQLATTLENYASKAAVDTLQALIPATATADNQLADKDFVNSSIATATAEFKGSFTSLDELKATSGNLNDYAFYLHKDSVGNSIVDRYKWTTAGWIYEYTLNNSSFTAEQWAALNSAITATLVNSYNNHLNNSIIHITSDERTKWNNKWDYNEETIKAVKVNAAISADKATKLATARKIWGRLFDGLADVSGDLEDVRNISASGKATIQGDIVCGGEVVAITGEGTPAGVADYSALTGKPSINGKELASGNNTLDELGIQPKGDYTTASQLSSTLEDYASKGVVNTIQALIPATASATNQLADKDFVNSSIATATAEFRGSFTSLDELKATSGNLNDYAFYLHTDNIGNKVVDRYKWTTAGWLYEYTLNNSSFTAEQWAALNSAITATLVQSYNNHLNNSIIHITAEERTKWNNKWDYNEETIKAVKVNAAVSADKLATANEGTSAIPIYFKNGKPAQCIPSDLFSVFDNAYSSTGERSLGITIAGHTKMVVVAYSTLAGSADKLATARKIWGRPFDGSADVSGDLKDVRNISASGKATIQGDIVCGGEVVAITGEGTPAGVTDYSALTGKPQINGVTLVSGNNTLAALGIQAAGDYVTNSGVTTLLANYADKTFVANNYASKTAFNSHTADSDIHITAAERAAWDAKWDYNENTIKAVKVNSASSADSVAWSGISGKPTTFTPSAHTHTASEVSGLPTSLKNPYALTFGSKTYDGSAAATITASDLGALTAHQSIYALTLQVNGTSKGVYNPASAAKTINIAVPTKTSDITNDSGFITSAAIPTALKNPYAVEIKANGVSLGTYDGSEAATFNLSAANVGAANRVHSHTASEISGLPTNLSAFTNDVGYITGITKSMVEGVLTGNITSHTHTFASLTSKPTTIAGYGITDAYTATTIDNKLSGYLPLSGGTISNQLSIDYNSVYPLVLNGLKNYSVINFRARGTDVSDVGWLNDYRGNLSYIANISYSGVISVNYDGVYYSDEFTNYKKYTIIHTGNYNSYAPTLTGTGASGTWGIDISGNASSATKLQDNTAFTVWGQTFFENGKPKNVSGDLNVGASKLYWNGDTEGSFISSIGMTHMTYEMRGGHNFCVGGDEILRIRKYGDYNLEVNGTGHITGDLIVDGEVSALVA